jgi:hypothetical protein
MAFVKSSLRRSSGTEILGLGVLSVAALVGSIPLFELRRPLGAATWLSSVVLGVTAGILGWQRVRAVDTPPNNPTDARRAQLGMVLGIVGSLGGLAMMLYSLATLPRYLTSVFGHDADSGVHVDN